MMSSYLLTVLKILTITFYSLKLTELSTVNLALSKFAIFCQSTAPSGLFDGNINRTEMFMPTCPGGKLEIDMGEEYSVHYVVVYEGRSRIPNAGQLSYFEVWTSYPSEDEACGIYPGVSLGRSGTNENKGLRVNCHASESQFEIVSVVPSNNIGLKIAEVEIHTFASDIPGDIPLLYRGCFREFPGFGTTMRYGLEGCKNDCNRIHKMYIGIKQNNICYCGDNYNDTGELPETDCYIKCNDGRSACGGIDGISVYLISVRLPVFIGCFENTRFIRLRKMTNRTEMTVEYCQHHCDKYQYALLTDGSVCGCRRELELEDFEARPIGECNKTCSGNSNQTCGGINCFSIYRTCYKNTTDTSTCTSLFKCSDRKLRYPLFRSCGGKCIRHFIGEHCLSKRFPIIITSLSRPIIVTPSSRPIIVTPSSRPIIVTFVTSSHTRRTQPTPINRCRMFNPCVNLSFTECIDFRNQPMCQCMVGYTKSSGPGCQDMDECQFKPCNEEYSQCVNRDGSYDCICKDEYVQLSEDICIENQSDEDSEDINKYKLPLRRTVLSAVMIIVTISLLITVCYICSNIPSPTDSLGRIRAGSSGSL